MFKVTDLSESGREIIDLMKDNGFSLDFPFNVCISSRGGVDNDGLPIVYEEGKEDTYKNHISLGHYIFEEIIIGSTK